MALLTAADMRADSLAEFASGCDLSASDVGDDAKITAAIARMVDRFQDWTNDTFVQVVAGTLDVDAFGSSILRLPQRFTAVTSVTFRLQDGSFSAAQSATSYRLHSSLNAAGTDEVGNFDWLESVPYGTGFSSFVGSGGPYLWPWGTQAVRVTGTYGWTTPPADAKRAVAMLVWDHFKPQRSDLGRAQSYSTAEVAISLSAVDDAHPSGIRDVDAIIQRLKRDTHIGVS